MLPATTRKSLSRLHPRIFTKEDKARMPSPRITLALYLLLHLVVTWWRSGVDAIRAVSPPVSAVGVVGQEAEFSCFVADKSADEVLTWQLEWDDMEFPQLAHLPTNQNITTFNYDGFFQEKHGTYTTRYRVNGSIHTTFLHIANIQPADEGSVSCTYQVSVGGSLITRMIPGYTAVRFTVWTPPSPTCSFRNLDPNTTALGSPTVGATVELSCDDTVGVPTPNLTWYVDVGKRNLSTTPGPPPHTSRHELRAQDNGRWFTCEARSPATTDPAVCSVRPMVVPPTAKVKPTQLRLIEGTERIDFTCTGTGLPEIVSHRWLIDGLPTDAVDNETYSNIKITPNATNGSVLTIEKISKLGETVLSCEVTVSAGLTGRANATVIIYRQEERRGVAFKVHAVRLKITPLAIAIPFIVLFLLVIMVIGLFIWHRKHRHQSRKPTADNDVQKLSPTDGANGAGPRHKKRCWAYRITSV